MATDQDQLILSIGADTTAIRNQLKKLTQDTTAATTRMKRDFDNLGRQAANTNLTAGVSRSMKAVQADAVNLRYQLNDIATGLASGGSPFTILSQQAGQLSQILSASGGGLGSSLKAIGGAALGMLNPINLAIAAVGVATYAATKYFEGVEEGGKAADKALEAQNQQLDQVISKWGELLPELAKVKAAQDAIAAAGEIRSATQNAIAAQYAAANTEISKLLPAIQAVSFALGRANENPKQAEELAGAYDHLAEAIKNGTATAGDLAPVLKILTDYSDRHNHVLSELIGNLSAQASGLDAAASKAKVLTEQEKQATNGQLELNKAIGQMAEIARLPISDMEQLIKLFDEAITKALALDNAVARGEAGRAALAAFRAGQTRIENTQSGGTAAKGGLVDRAANAKIAARISQLDDTFAERLNVLLAEFPGAKIQSAFRTFAEQAAIYDSGVRPAARPGHSLHEKGQAADLSGIAPADYARLHARAQELGINFGVKGDPLHAQLTETGTAAKKAASDLDEWLAKQRQAIDLQKQANAIRGDSTQTISQQNAAIEEAKLFQEGLNAAVQQYGTVSEAQKEAIRATAHEMAQLGVVSDEAAAKQKAAAKTVQENQEAWAQLGQQFAGIASSAINGLVQDLQNGVSAGEAFRNMLSRIVNDLLQMALNQTISKIFSGLFGAPSGGQYGIASGGGIGLYHSGGIAGQGTVRRGGVNPGIFAGAQRYHSGGIAGLRPGEVPAILQRGEMVVPALQAGRSSTGSVSLGDVNIDMAQSGYVTADTSSAKAWGENVRKIIQVEMVRQSRPGGLLVRRPV